MFNLRGGGQLKWKRCHIVCAGKGPGPGVGREGALPCNRLSALAPRLKLPWVPDVRGGME